MARTLVFYGDSDDLFECVGTRGDEPDEIGCYAEAAVVKISDGDVGLVVVGMWDAAGNGCWTIGISPLDENAPLPPWPMSWATHRYSTQLTIDVPDTARVEHVSDEDE